MGWLDQTDIGHDLQICPDCDRAYEVLDQFFGASFGGSRVRQFD